MSDDTKDAKREKTEKELREVAALFDRGATATGCPGLPL